MLKNTPRNSLETPQNSLEISNRVVKNTWGSVADLHIPNLCVQANDKRQKKHPPKYRAFQIYFVALGGQGKSRVTQFQHDAYVQCFLIKKFRIRETKNLSTDADSRTDTILERLRDLSNLKERKKIECLRDFSQKKI